MSPVPTFPRASDAAKFLSLDPRLQNVLAEVFRIVPFTIVWGHRGEEAQNEAFAGGKSQDKWPDSAHNKLPSLAVDIAPWPGLYDRHIKDWYYLSGIAKGVAEHLGTPVIAGSDWDGDGQTQDQKLHDPGHLELKA